MKANPRILIFTVASWNSKVGSNTWATLVDGYPAENLANICIRDDYPDSSVCSRYFVISENRIIKSLLNRKIKTGYEVCKDKTNNQDLQEHKERYARMSRKRGKSMLLAREAVWKLGKWKTPELDAFLDDFKPDIILHSMEGYIHLNRVVQYAIARTKARVIGYIWDDNFTYKQSSGIGFYFYRFLQRRSLKHLAARTNDFFAISEKTKTEADSFFGIDSTVLTKPLISVPACENTSISYPIHMLYTGKLIIGRDRTVRKIADAIEEVNNRQGNHLFLDVYTNTVLDNEVLASIENKWCKIHPPIPQSEVYALQRKADILLFVEALDGPNSKTARLSFSTKITDYLSTGKCIFAVGNQDTAPISYFLSTKAALVAYEEDMIRLMIAQMVENPSLLIETAQQGARTALERHAPEKIRDTFWRVIRRT